VPDAGLGRTPGGLVRRARQTPAASDPPGPAPVDDQTLVEALGRYVPRGPTPPSPAAGGPPPGAGAPDGPGAPGGLTRRVPGAQLPEDQVVPLRGGGLGPTGGSRSAPRSPVGRSGGRGALDRLSAASEQRRAHDVQTLLSDFTAGVQRGLADARRQLPPSSAVGHPAPNGNGHTAGHRG
jgi:hypothetical protein